MTWYTKLDNGLLTKTYVFSKLILPFQVVIICNVSFTFISLCLILLSKYTMRKEIAVFILQKQDRLDKYCGLRIHTKVLMLYLRSIILLFWLE